MTTQKKLNTTSHARIRIRYCKSCDNPYQVLQITRAVSECAMKSKVRMIKLLSPQYQAIPEKNITRLLPSALLLKSNKVIKSKYLLSVGFFCHYALLITAIPRLLGGGEGGGVSLWFT